MPVISWRKRWRILLAFALAMPLALWACSEQGAENAAERAASAPPAASAGAGAQADPAVYRGAAVAGQVCAQCHDIGTGTSPTVFAAGATAFTEVAQRADTTAASLNAWLRSSHPSMPHYMFNDAEAADIVAYIMSLRAPK